MSKQNNIEAQNKFGAAANSGDFEQFENLVAADLSLFHN